MDCAGEQSVVFVEEAEGAAVGVMDAPEQLEALMERLNQNGLREKVLHHNLEKRKDMILNTLGYHAVNLDVSHAPRYTHNQMMSSILLCSDPQSCISLVIRMQGLKQLRACN